MNISLLRQLKHLAIDLEFDDKNEEAEAVNDVIEYVRELERQVNADKEEGEIRTTITDPYVVKRYCDFLDNINVKWEYKYNPNVRYAVIFIHTTGRYERKCIEEAQKLFGDIEKLYFNDKENKDETGWK